MDAIKLLDKYSTSYNGNHLRVARRDGRSGIPWEHLQTLKSYFAGTDAVAVEIYPPDDEVVNDTNMRHLWIVDSIPVGCNLKDGR